MTVLSNNSRNWKLVTTISKNFKSDSRIISTSEKFNSNFLIVRVSTKAKKETWNFGGRLWISYSVLNQQTKIHQTDLDLFEQELIIISKLFEDKYSLIYQAPYYFPDVTLKVWEYTGIITESKQTQYYTSNINQIITKLNQIQTKLNECCNSDNIQARKAEEIIINFTGFL